MNAALKKVFYKNQHIFLQETLSFMNHKFFHIDVEKIVYINRLLISAFDKISKINKKRSMSAIISNSKAQELTIKEPANNNLSIKITYPNSIDDEQSTPTNKFAQFTKIYISPQNSKRHSKSASTNTKFDNIKTPSKNDPISNSRSSSKSKSIGKYPMIPGLNYGASNISEYTFRPYNQPYNADSTKHKPNAIRSQKVSPFRS